MARTGTATARSGASIDFYDMAATTALSLRRIVERHTGHPVEHDFHRFAGSANIVLRVHGTVSPAQGARIVAESIPLAEYCGGEVRFGEHFLYFRVRSGQEVAA